MERISIEQLERTLYLDSPFELVIRAAGLIERSIEAAIAAAMPTPHEIELRRSSWSLKLDLVIGLGMLPHEMGGMVRQLLDVRHRIAHDYNATVSLADARDFVNAWPARARTVLNRAPADYDEDPWDGVREGVALIVFTLQSGAAATRDTHVSMRALSVAVRDLKAGRSASDVYDEFQAAVTADRQARESRGEL